MATAGMWLVLIALGAWFAWCLRRFQVYWDAGDVRIGRLGAALRQAQRELGEEQRTQEKLGHEIKQLERQTEKCRGEERQLRQKQREAPPPPPIEVLVSAEIPASASEDPWIANFLARRANARATDRPARPILFWAAGSQAAMIKSQQLAGDLTVNDVRKLTPAG